MTSNPDPTPPRQRTGVLNLAQQYDPAEAGTDLIEQAERWRMLDQEMARTIFDILADGRAYQVQLVRVTVDLPGYQLGSTRYPLVRQKVAELDEVVGPDTFGPESEGRQSWQIEIAPGEWRFFMRGPLGWTRVL